MAKTKAAKTKAKAKPAAKTKAKAKPAAKTKAKANPATKAKKKAKAKPAAKTKPKAKAKPAAKKKAKAKTKPAAKTKAKAKTKPAAKKKAKTKPAAKTKAKAKTKPAAKTKSKAKAKTKSKPAAKTKTKAKAKTKSKPAAKTKTKARTRKVLPNAEAFRAARSGDAEALEHALELGGDPTIRDRTGYSAIHRAALANAPGCLRVLHARGFDLLQETDDGEYETAVHLAARQGALDALRAFAELGVDLDRPRNVCNETPIFAAIEGGQVEAVRLLLELGADATYTYSSRFETGVVQHAAGEGQVAVLRLLGERGFPLCQGPGHPSPLHLAIDSGQTAAVRFLVAEAGVTLDEREDGYGPLERAGLRGYADTLRALLELGADANALAPDGTPVAFRCRSVAGLSALLEHGLDLSLRDAQGRTAGFYQQDACLRLLVERGLPLHVHDANGQTLLHGRHRYACGLVDLRYLLEQGLDPNAQDMRGDTALALAVADGDRAAVELLIANGADPNLANDLGRSALDVAADRGDASLLRLLNPAPLAPDEQSRALGRLLDGSDAALLERFAAAVSGVPVGEEPLLAEACLLYASANLLASPEIKFGMPEVLRRAQLLYGPDVDDQLPALFERYGLGALRSSVDQAISIAARTPAFWDDKYTEPAFNQLLLLGDRMPPSTRSQIRAALAARLREELPGRVERPAVQTLLRRVE